MHLPEPRVQKTHRNYGWPWLDLLILNCGYSHFVSAIWYAFNVSVLISVFFLFSYIFWDVPHWTPDFFSLYPSLFLSLLHTLLWMVVIMWFIHTKSWFGVVSRVACGAGERNSDISIHGRHKPMHDRVYVCWAALCNAVCTRDMCVCDRRLDSQHSTRSPPHTWTLRCCQCWLLVWLELTSPVSPSRLAVSCVWSPARQRGDAA